MLKRSDDMVSSDFSNIDESCSPFRYLHRNNWKFVDIDTGSYVSLVSYVMLLPASWYKIFLKFSVDVTQVTQARCDTGFLGKRRQRQRKRHSKINIWQMVTILWFNIASSSQPLLLIEQAANGLVEVPLKKIYTMRDLLLCVHVVVKTLRWLYILFYKGFNVRSALITFPLANVFHIALGIRSLIKTYSVRLHMEDSFRTQMLLPWQLLIEMLALFFEPTWLLDGVSRFLYGELGKQSKHPRSFAIFVFKTYYIDVRVKFNDFS